MTAFAIYGGLFISAFLAASILPASSEAVLMGLLAAGRGDPILLLLVATTGNTLGSVTNWVLGRGVDRLRTKSWFPVTPERYEMASLIFRRYGAWTLLLAWLPVVGDAFTIAAGAARTHFGLFVVLVGIGKAVRYAVIAAGMLWAMS